MTDPHPDDDYFNAWEFVLNLPPEMQQCRGGRSHNWIDGKQVHRSVDHGVVHHETLCARGCGTIRVEDFTLARGHYTVRPHYRYKKPYQVKASEHGPVHPADIAGAMRVINHYRDNNLEIPKPSKTQRKRSA